MGKMNERGMMGTILCECHRPPDDRLDRARELLQMEPKEPKGRKGRKLWCFNSEAGERVMPCRAAIEGSAFG